MPTIAPGRQSVVLKPHDDRDSIGLAKLQETQLRAVVELVKRHGRLSEPVPKTFRGRGIVVAGGGRYLDFAYVNCRWLREKGIELPIQVWYLGPEEMPDWARQHFRSLDVELVDAWEVRKKHWHRRLVGWSLKHYAAMRCPFEDVVLYDADCFAFEDPKLIFECPEYRQAGALFFKDVNKCRLNNWAFFYAKVRVPDSELDSGLFAWNRRIAWEGIKWTTWMGEHSEAWDKVIYGDKDRPLLGFGTSDTPYAVSPRVEWAGWGIRHFVGETPVAGHAMAYKRGEHGAPDPRIPELFMEWSAFSKEKTT